MQPKHKATSASELPMYGVIDGNHSKKSEYQAGRLYTWINFENMTREVPNKEMSEKY